ncbi:MAG: hypothetical protein KF832_05880 [Caldilineaceae bacterium]|nr:hypothetical protein [Caldilineaceae bacterium]
MRQCWDSWAALKAEYAEEYGPLLDSLKERASDSWKVQNGIEQYGESLIKADVRNVFGLPSQTISATTVTGTGAAAEYLQQEAITENGVTKGVKLTVLAESADTQTVLPFAVTLHYTDGTTETVKYGIVNALALNLNPIYLPLVSNGDGNQVSRASVNQANDWGPWSYWWADGDAGSNRYGQVTVGGCASGCGGTAWAMLFGWVDRRAADTGAWAGHWGIYRANGGGAGAANVVAPLTQDAGVQNMTLEIRNHIGTFCIAGSGATWPWNMIDAANYVRPRATAGWRMQTKYDPTGLCWFGACDGNRNLARDAIVNRRQPAIVGSGWLKHYPLAYGYAERSKRSCFLFFCSTDYSRWFYVNNGWYGNNGWTGADVWFAGTYYRN